MTVNYEAKVREVKAELDQASAAQARVRVQAESAGASLKAAREQLVTLYGVETTEAAQAKLSELEAALADAITATKEALSRV